MSFSPDYLIVGLVIFGMNAAPAFMPPTWSILALFHVSYRLNVIPLVIIGASCATLGRMVLYFLSAYFRKYIPKNSGKNLSALGDFFNKNKKFSFSIFLLYGFSPIPSNQLFILAGLSGWDIFILSSVFFLMRLVTYTIWVNATKLIATNLEGIFQSHYTHINVLLLDVFGLLLVYFISIIPWMKILKTNKKIRK